jgi:Pyridoxamine 5'-phosphate oxidase
MTTMLTIGSKLQAFLDEPLLAVVTTLNEHGAPEMTPIWYEYFDGSIWFNGTRTRQWLQRMETTGRATFFLLDRQNDWRWAQVYGRVVEASDDPEVEQFSRLGVRYGRPIKPPIPNRRFVRVEITSVKGRAGTPSELWD